MNVLDFCKKIEKKGLRFMSVRVNDRHVSDIEYENTYSKLNFYLSNKLKRIPNRYGHYLRTSFNEILSKTYIDIMNMSNNYMKDRKNGIDRYRNCAEIIEGLSQIVSFSYTYWNLSSRKQNEIKYIKASQRIFWANFINKEISLICGVMNKCRKDTNIKLRIPNMKPYTNADFKNVLFLNKLSKLQRIIYQRAIHISQNNYDVQMEVLVELSRSALFNACEGNNIFVGNDETLLRKRTKYFSECISNLMSMNRPIKELAFNDIFSESELQQICTLLTECQCILKSVKEYDSEKFKNIQQ